MAQEYSELDIAASDAVLIRQTLEEILPKVEQAEVRETIIALLTLTKKLEARVALAALGFRIVIRFARRATISRQNIAEYKQIERLYAGALLPATTTERSTK